MIWKRTRHSHRGKQDPLERAIKQADLDMLELAAAVGEIDLWFLDESGFSLWSQVSYSYYFRGAQKRLEQTKRKGRRISILGLLQPLVTFVYALVVGSFKSDSYIEVLDEQARQAQQVLEKEGRIRVIVQDNGPIHTSKVTRQKWKQWQEQGLYVFFIAKYCSETNPIETEWRQLKEHELVGQMFEDELDLAYAVIDGVENRAQEGGYTAERYRFPSRLEASSSVT